MKRKLASIQKISNIKNIEGSDYIAQATIMGWNIVVKKDEFKINDRCVFFEIDSILPDVSWAEFLRPRKFRVKTCKIRGVLSQGLALPLSILGGKNSNRTLWDRIRKKDGWKIGDDVTNYLKIKKFNILNNKFKRGTCAGNFPSFIPKTDEIRIQSSIKKLDYIKNKDIYITVKCDGTSSTFYKFNGKFGVCSRNKERKEGDNIYWNMADYYTIQHIPDGIAVQGEIVGPNIQKNKMGLSKTDLFVFDIFDIKLGKYFEYNELVKFCYDYKLKMVPEIKADDVENTLEYWLEKAKGKYDGTSIDREDIVVRTKIGRLSFKVINNDYLIKEN